MAEKITVQQLVKAPISKVWECWTKAEHIVHWNFASPDWHCPKAVNDLKPGGKFSYTMAARDGSVSFDFGGTYNEVVPLQRIVFTIGDGRKVEVQFSKEGEHSRITEVFEAEQVHSLEQQRDGWQAILNSFAGYAVSR